MQRVLFTTLLAATVLPGCKRPPPVQEDPDGQAALEAWARAASETAAPPASVIPETASPPTSPEATLDEHRKAMATAANDGDYAAVCKGTPWVQPTLCLWVAARAAGKPVERPDGGIFRAYFGKEHWSHAYGRIVGKAGENGDYEVSVGGYRHHCVLDVIDTNFENEGTFNLWVQEQPTTREVTLNSGDTEQWVVLEEAVLAKDLIGPCPFGQRSRVDGLGQERHERHRALCAVRRGERGSRRRSRRRRVRRPPWPRRVRPRRYRSCRCPPRLAPRPDRQGRIRLPSREGVRTRRVCSGASRRATTTRLASERARPSARRCWDRPRRRFAMAGPAGRRLVATPDGVGPALDEPTPAGCDARRQVASGFGAENVGGEHDSEPQLAPDVREGEIVAGKYRIGRVLATGGMGVIVAAHHVHLHEKVALKFLLPHALARSEAVARFLREARAAAKIKSEHVARVTDVGTLPDGSPYMAMEYLEGGDLSAWLRQRGPLPVELAVEFVLQACVAVAEAHALGIIHRDLKPSNLFCVRRSDGQLSIKVLDFGISKLTLATETDPSLGMTTTTTLMGSPLHVAGADARVEGRGRCDRCLGARHDVVRAFGGSHRLRCVDGYGTRHSGGERADAVAAPSTGGRPCGPRSGGLQMLGKGPAGSLPKRG